MAPSKPTTDGPPSGTPEGGDLLARYRAKRRADATPEPVAGQGPPRPGLFVVQQHNARNLHWDLRLEIGGVLASWAVPKGPSLDPADKRFAVRTEDHPVEYGDFEGVIPEGNYGAGEMIVWDRGRWVPHDDPVAGLQEGKLLFDLEGYKLRGLWTLVRTGGRRRPDSREWLLIKKPDGWAIGAAGGSGEPPGDASVLSGLTLEELRDRSRRARELAGELAARGVPRLAGDLADLRPMLARVAPEPFSRPGWIFELKYDGFRALAAKERRAGGAELRSRNGRDVGNAFPEILRAVGSLPFRGLLLDGELTVLDQEARPDFSRLQRRAGLSRRPDVERAAVQEPAVLFVFDVPALEGFDLRPLPLVERKEILRRLLPAAGPVRYADHVAERGEELYALARRRGLEGVMAKKADAPYAEGRSSAWLKLRHRPVEDFIVVGWKPPGGQKPAAGLGSLELAELVAPADEATAAPRLVSVGSAGAGLGEDLRRRLQPRLAELVRPDSPLAEESPAAGEEVTWVEPRLVVEVSYLERTPRGHLRQPAVERLRPDKPAGECLRSPDGVRGGPGQPPGSTPGVAEDPGDGAEATAEHRQAELSPLLSNLDKVFWPGRGLTKGDLLAYYQAVSPWLLPYLEDRPLVLDRYPDGIEGKSFFQKNAPEYAPDWVPTAAVWSEEGQRETRYFVCDSPEALLYLINLGTIPLHVWGSRLASLQRPDWCILDLDAKEAPFRDAVAVARVLRRLTRDAGLPAHLKTSGATGLHVLLPLGGRITFEQSRQLAAILARLAAEELPDRATTARTVRLRQGRVYVDALQNGYGKLLVAPFAVRPLPGAPVSMPLRWEELDEALDPRDFHLGNAIERLRGWSADPLAPVLTEAPDLLAALERLAKQL